MFAKKKKVLSFSLGTTLIVLLVMCFPPNGESAAGASTVFETSAADV